MNNAGDNTHNSNDSFSLFNLGWG